MRHYVIGLVTLLLATSCHMRRTTPQTASKFKEAPDNANMPKMLGIEGPYKWDDVKTRTKADLEHPWSDTYWPLEQRGLALRWMGAGGGSDISERPVTLYDALQQVKLAEKTKPELMTYLSPAEKYDLIVSSTDKIPADMYTAMQKNADNFNKNFKDKLKPLQDAAAGLEKQQDDLVTKYNTLEEQLKALNEKYNKAVETKDEKTAADLKKQIESMVAETTKIETEYERLNGEMSKNRVEQRKVATKFNEEVVAISNKLRAYMPMTAGGWEEWASWEASPIENYSWMGHCHGWAPAALVEKRPAHAVMVANKGRKILFTEGDIRGLITKAWADQAPDTSFFGARRCEATTLKKDERGRVLDGNICYDAPDKKCSENDKAPPIYIVNNVMENGAIEFMEQKKSTSTKIGIVDAELGEDNYTMNIFDSFSDYKKWKDSEGKVKVPMKKASVSVTMGCRDTNPMTMHLALTELIAKKKTGFVVDVTRTSEVWNQPVYAYDMEFLPIALNKKDPTGATLSKPGEPVSVDEIVDPFESFRAPNTKYLVVVRTKMKYGLENGPMVDFDVKAPYSDDEGTTMELVYTLELDKDKNLIGGEWGPVPKVLKEGEKDDDTFRSQLGGESPDFIWYYTKDSKVKDGDLKAAVFEKLLNCSLAKPNGKVKVKNPDDPKKEIEVDYSDCPIEI